MADKPNVAELTAHAVLELARLGRVTDDTYDALKAAVTPDDDEHQGDDDAAETETETGVTKAAAARKATNR